MGRRSANVAEYHLSGHVVCDGCNRHYGGLRGRGRHGGRFRYYVCLGRRRRGVYECDAPPIPAPRQEEAVFGALRETFTRPDFLEQAVAAAAMVGALVIRLTEGPRSRQR